MPVIHTCWENTQSTNCINNVNISAKSIITVNCNSNTDLIVNNNNINNFSDCNVDVLSHSSPFIVPNSSSLDNEKGQNMTNGSHPAKSSFLDCSVHVTKQLKFMIWNIHGLANKLDSKEFVEYINKYDIVVFLETMKRDPFEPVIRNFEFVHFQRKYQHPRARRPAGGMGIMIRTTLTNTNTVTIVKKSDFSVWLKIKQQGDLDLYIGAVYIPPLDSTSTISSFQDNNAYHLLQEDVTHFSQKGYVSLCGDFNARTGTLIDYVTTCGNDTHDVYVPQTK